jgi:hypothetical protein
MLLGLQSCAVPLHDDGGATSAQDAAATPPVAAGCRPFQGVASRVTGAVRSAGMAADTVFVLDDAVVGGTEVPALTLAATAAPSLADCLASAVPATPPASALPALDAPRAALATGAAAYLFYDQIGAGYGVVALGSAPGTPLWTSDRPAYGTAAVTDAGTAYVYGCLATGFLDGDCYVARADAASIGEESAYEYYAGGGRWSAQIEDAWPMTSGGTEVDVTWWAPQSRWILAYVAPLGDTIALRSGLTPSGPWSAPIPVATCDLADADMFCAGVHFLAGVSVETGSVALSYAVGSLSADAAARQSSDPLDWWPRVFALKVPALP